MSDTSTNAPTKRVNDIEAVFTSLFRNLGNGVAAASDFAKIVHAVVNSRDTTIFSRMLGEFEHKVATKKRDAAAIKAMRRVFKAVFPDAKMLKKDGKPVFKIAGAMPDMDAVKRMDEAVKKGLSLRDTFANYVVGETAREPATFDPKATAERLVKAHKEHPEHIDQLIAALQQARQAIAGNGEPVH
jgi:hypothetical protein